MVPSENSVVTSQYDYVRLRIPDSGKAIETIKPLSVPGALKNIVQQFPNTAALGYKEGDKWITISYQ